MKSRSIIAMSSIALVGTSLFATQKPNFVFIYVDDMGWTGTSVEMEKGNSETKSDFYETPNIEKLAKSGMVFSKAYSPASMSTPSRASVLTGKSPAQLHITTPGRVQREEAWQKVVPASHITEFPEKEVTIAELLKKEGYATALFGKWHLNGGGPGKHGFDSHDGDTGNPKDMKFEESNPKDIFGITERGKEFIQKQVKAKKPFFVQLSHYAVHSPEESLEKTKNCFEDKKSGKKHSKVDYAAMTKDFDTSVGMILDEIEKHGISKKTYVVFMSDNGAAGGKRRSTPENYPLRAGKGSLWEGGVRVPLIISGPGIKGGQYSSKQVIGFDLFPTFCEWARIKSSKIPQEVEGESLVSLLKNRAFKRNDGFLVFHNPHYGKGLKQIPQSAIIAGNFKLVRDYETGRNELYDLSKDVSEESDISSKKETITEKLSTKLDAYLKKVDALLPTKNENYNPNVKRERPKRKKVDRI